MTHNFLNSKKAFCNFHIVLCVARHFFFVVLHLFIVVENLIFLKMIRNSLRERYEKKRKERQDILETGGLAESSEEKKSLIFNEGKIFSLSTSRRFTQNSSFQTQKQRNAAS